MSTGTASPMRPAIHAHDHRGGMLCRWTLHRREDFAFMIVGEGPHLCTGEEVPVRVDYVTKTDEELAISAVLTTERIAQRKGRLQATPVEVAAAVLQAVLGASSPEDSLRKQRVMAAVDRESRLQSWKAGHPWLSRLPESLRRHIYP